MDAVSRMTPLGVAAAGSVASAANLPQINGAIPSGPNVVALIIPETQNVRFRDDGTDPTSTVGMLLVAGQPFLYTGNLSALRMIQVAATAAVTVAYYKRVG